MVCFSLGGCIEDVGDNYVHFAHCHTFTVADFMNSEGTC